MLNPIPIDTFLNSFSNKLISEKGGLKHFSYLHQNFFILNTNKKRMRNIIFAYMSRKLLCHKDAGETIEWSLASAKLILARFVRVK